MTDPVPLDEQIAALRYAEHEVAAIYEAGGDVGAIICGIRAAHGTERDHHTWWHEPGRAAHFLSARPPQFTTSIDAALTLVPRGWWVRSIEGEQAGREWWAQLEQIKAPYLRVMGEANENFGAYTISIALCIAALKALQAKIENT